MAIIMVKLNGKDYPTQIDKHGVQRFVENPIVSNLVHKNIGAHDKLSRAEYERIGVYGLNEIALDYYTGASGITLEHLLDFYTQTGYSVSGMLDLSYFEDVEVDNPLWH